MIEFRAKIHSFSRAAVLLLAFSSCSGLQQASHTEPLLIENNITINGKASQSDDDYEILRQRPNKGWAGVRLFLSMYGAGEKISNTGVGKWLMNIGEPPVYLDSLSRVQSASQLGIHYFNLGYFNAKVTSYDEVKGRKAKAFYDVNTGPKYTLSSFELHSTNRFIDSALAYYPPLFSTGDGVVAEDIEQAQLDLTNFLKNNGYFKAQLGWVYFELDTAHGPKEVNLIGVVDPYSFGGDVRRRTLTSIRAQPTYDYGNTTVITDSTRTSNGIDVVQNGLKFRPEFIDQQIFLSTGDSYNSSAIKETYKNLVALGVFKSVEIDIVESGDDLMANLKLTPLSKRSVSAGIEGLGNNGSIGLGGQFSWDNRNLFKGGEVLRLSLGGSVTEQRNSTNTTWLLDARELNASGSLRFPKFLLPTTLLPKKSKYWQPRTEIGLKSSFQFRVDEFNRNVLSSYLEYRWKVSGAQYTLSPWRFSFVQIDFTSDSTLAPFLFNGFQDLVFAQSGYRMNKTWTQGNTRYFTAVELETGGHLWRSMGLTSISGVPLMPFAKGSVDLRLYQPLVHQREIALRTFLGLSQHWSPDQSFMPFEKSFFMGGANDMRGWTAYHFGPGATSEELLRTRGYFAAAPIKFVVNAEYRFTMHDAWKGAVFLDAGNMWLYNRSYGNDLTADQLEAISKGTFGWNSFYKQFGLNTGVGFRYDLEFFIMRADIALKVHHPGAVDRSNWVIQDPKWHDFNLTLGIGYPF